MPAGSCVEKRRSRPALLVAVLDVCAVAHLPLGAAPTASALRIALRTQHARVELCHEPTAAERAEKLASDTEVVRLAEKNAQQIMEEARDREREVRLGAEDYADEVLGNLEMNLDKFIAAVRRGRERLQGRGSDDELQP